MKKLLLMTLLALVPGDAAGPEPSLFVRPTNAYACQWLKAFAPDGCVQNVLAIAYQLPVEVKAVKFELTYLDRNGAPVYEVYYVERNSGSATMYRRFDGPLDVNLFSSVRVTATFLAATGSISSQP